MEITSLKRSRRVGNGLGQFNEFISGSEDRDQLAKDVDISDSTKSQSHTSRPSSGVCFKE